MLNNDSSAGGERASNSRKPSAPAPAGMENESKSNNMIIERIRLITAPTTFPLDVRIPAMRNRMKKIIENAEAS